MTSNEKRKEKRYQRRKNAREQKKKCEYKKYDDLSRVASYNALFRAAKKSMKNVAWKESVQRYQMNLLRNIAEANRKLMAGENVTRGFVEFATVERGKTRYIRSVHFSERVIQRATCDNVLVPMLSRGLIHDNGACREGMGVDHALDRVEAQLRRHYRNQGGSNTGAVLLFDFSGYFDSIDHEQCFGMYRAAFEDRRILELLESFVKPFGYPVAPQAIKEYNGRLNIRSPECWKHFKRGPSSGEYSGKSLGLGSQVSQITAVAYPTQLDYCILQNTKQCGYERYMDDGWILFRTAADAVEALNQISDVCLSLGIKLNQKKTKIINLRGGFTFLKTKFRLTDSGKVVRSICSASVTDRRRKLMKHAKMVAAGRITVEDAKASYGSWKGYALRRGGGNAVLKMDKRFRELIGETPPTCKLKK